ncbi:MAG: glycoside hydrolase family 18 protein, partial [Niameybacter sp.]
MYYPEWGIYSGHGEWTPDYIPYDKITHLNYAFFTIKNGEIALFDEWAATGAALGEAWDSEFKGVIGAVRKAKQNYPDVRLMMSIGGWSQSAYFHEVSATDASRQKFADSCVTYLRDYNFDGVDIDWEYPTFKREGDKQDNPNDQGTPYADASEKETFTLLLKTLREALDKAGNEDNKYYELSAAVGAGVDKMAQTELTKYHQYLDFINLMSYDFHGAWEDVTGHQSALFGRTQKEGNPYDQVTSKYNVHDSVTAFLKAGVPSNKLVVGIPYYTRGWANVEGSPSNTSYQVNHLPGLHHSVKKGSFSYGVK